MVTGTKNVVCEAQSFYEGLYSAGPVVAESQDALLDCLDSTLSLEQVQALETPFTSHEVMRAIKHSSSSSSPEGMASLFHSIRYLVSTWQSCLLNCIIRYGQ